MKKCASCGQEYDDSENQCFKCGSNIIDKRASDILQIATVEHAMREARQEGKTIGFRESETLRQFSSADTSDTGAVSFQMKGKPIQGEDDTRSVGQLLAQAMNVDNGQWELTDKPAVGVVDCFLRDRSDPMCQLKLQVVRAIVDTALYQKLAYGKDVSEVSINPADVAARMYEAVTKKVQHLLEQERRGLISKEERQELILVLDATRLSVCTMFSVIEAYRQHFGPQTYGLDFMQVWLVGPTTAMTHRLDT